jgi:hypothetical protein
MSPAAKKPSFSAAFPASAAIVATFREVFGEDVKPMYCIEGGESMGQPSYEDPRKTVGLGDIVILTKKSKLHGR